MSENTSYISLANKYRPQKFEDMVGQESISKTLKNALKLGRIAHAYLFYGPRGCGKTTTARILAKALNCTGKGNGKPTDEPCGECPQCREIAQSADMDVLELDAASNTQVEKVREAIIDTVALAASRDRFKVFILDEVHMLSASSFNALLKTIEEPPSHVVFILATTEKHKVPATITSRCQTFRFRPITADEITNHLLELAEAEGLDLTEKAARIIAKNAGGALRDALTLLDRAIAFSDGKIDDKLVGEMLGLTPQDLLNQTVTALIEKDNASLHAAFETLRAEGFDANSFLKDLKNALGELFYFSLGQGSAPFEGAAKITKFASAGLLAALSRKVNKLTEEVKFSDNALISAEVGLFTIMDSCFDIEGFIRRLEALERGGTGDGTGGTTLPPAGPVKKQEKQISSSAVPVAQKTDFSAKKETKASSGVQENVYYQEDLSSIIKETPTAKITDNNALWKALLKEFEKSPFVYDVLTNCSVQFGADVWTISFGTGKEFYKVPAQTKLPELEKKALALSGRKIRFEIAQTAASAKADSFADQPKKVPNTIAKPIPTAAAQEPISQEEPLVKADFSADVEPESALTEVPEELKRILDVIGGEVLV